MTNEQRRLERIAAGGRWCILRTSGGRTMPLARSLTAAGLDAWTPIAVARKQVRRGPAYVMVERASPIAPTFVFGNADQLADFANVRTALFNPHPPFSIFQWGGRVPIIGESAIAGLREREREAHEAIEAQRTAIREESEREERRQARADRMKTEQQRRKALRAEHRDLPTGLRVAIREMPAMAGLSGTVVESRGTSAVVAFGGSLVMTIEAWQIMPCGVVSASLDAA